MSHVSNASSSLRRSPWARLPLAAAGSALLAGTLSAQLGIATIDGPGPDQAFGNDIAKLSDVNADGVNDLLVGAFTKNNSRGAACVLSGKTGAVLQTWNGIEDFEYLGQCVAAIGDIDKDGVNDVAIGAPYFDVAGKQSGRVLICSPKTGAILRTHLGPPATANFGAGLAGFSDYDSDGWADYAISSPFLKIDGSFDQGQVTLYSGKTGAVLVTLNGPTTQGSKFGTVISNAGDVNGDGRTDLAISSPEWASTITGFDSGRVEVRSGANLFVTLFAAEGQNIDEKMGFEMAAAGDVNHDGLADIIAGCYFTNTDAGVARVFLGPSGAASWVFTGDFAYDHFACSVDGAGDVDKDGYADLIVGAYRAASQIAVQPGYARVYSGRTGQTLVTLTGSQGNDQFGYAVAGVGDLNGDGWTDVAVASRGYDSVNGANSGRVQVIEVLKHATNLGFGGPGSAQLAMYGSALDDFGQMDLALTGAKPSAPAWLLASAGTSFLAFKSGVIVPDIGTGVTIALTTNGSGKITVPGILGGFGPVNIVMQYVIQDAAQPLGFAMSNAVSASFLP